MSITLFTPTPTLPHQGGGDIGGFLSHKGDKGDFFPTEGRGDVGGFFYHRGERDLLGFPVSVDRCCYSSSFEGRGSRGFPSNVRGLFPSLQ